MKHTINTTGPLGYILGRMYLEFPHLVTSLNYVLIFYWLIFLFIFTKIKSLKISKLFFVAIFLLPSDTKYIQALDFTAPLGAVW